MRLLLLLAVTACDAGGKAPAPRPVPSPVPVTPSVPASVPAVAAAPVIAPAESDAHISIDSLVRPILPLEPARRVRTNPYLDDALSNASHGGTDELGQVVRGVLAVAADPSSVPARFVEACLLAQVDQHELAHAVMSVVHEAGCAACGDALLELRNDICRFDDNTKKLADNVKPSPMRAATTTILASLNSGNDAIDAYLDGGAITMESTCSVCDDLTTSTKKYNAATFKAYVRDADKRSGDARIYSSPVFLFCDAHCCSGPTGYLNHSASFVTEVCFRGGATAPKLASIGTLDG